MARVSSQTCTAGQFFEREYLAWCDKIRDPRRLHRKQWEHVFILQALHQSGIITKGSRGVGFGCGTEPMVAWLASHGCKVLATDLSIEDVAGKGWVETNQHAHSKEALNERGICDPVTFDRNVSFRAVDMNAIPTDIDGFDFTWSSCALEHLGSLRHGLEFIKNSVLCLRSGGIAVHTTELNLSSNDTTMEDPGCVIYRKKDIEAFVQECAAEGIEVTPVNWQTVSGPADERLDAPPFSENLHIKIRLGDFVDTSIGLILRKL